VGIALLAWFGITKVFSKPTLGLSVGIGLISHLILDLITHAHDIALAPGVEQPKFGLGLYGAVPVVGFVLEILYGTFCWWVYQGRKALLLVIVFFNVANLSMLSSAVTGPEALLAGHFMRIVSVVAFQIAVTLTMVGFLSRKSNSSV
jgi:hypothetical protein